MSPKGLKWVKFSVLVMSLALVVGFFFLIMGLYNQGQKLGKKQVETSTITPASLQDKEAIPAWVNRLELQAGQEMHSFQVNGDRLIINIHDQNQNQSLHIYDIPSAKLIGRLDIIKNN